MRVRNFKSGLSRSELESGPLIVGFWFGKIVIYSRDWDTYHTITRCLHDDKHLGGLEFSAHGGADLKLGHYLSCE